MTCKLCKHAKREGWWGDPTVTHCRDCHSTWPLSKTRWQHCVRCHQTFGGDEAAVRHLDRDGNCRPPAEVEHKNGRRILSQDPTTGVWSRIYGA